MSHSSLEEVIRFFSFVPIALYPLSSFSHHLSTSMSFLSGLPALELLGWTPIVSVVCQDSVWELEWAAE